MNSGKTTGLLQTAYNYEVYQNLLLRYKQYLYFYCKLDNELNLNKLYFSLYFITL